MDAPIGVIDSGVGGLTVAKEIMRQLPNETIYYIGDTARCPYGPRTKEEVKIFTWQMARYLQKQEIKMLVIACNTATAVALDDLQRKLTIPVIGVIHPGARAAIKKTKENRIVVLATEGTVKSGAYDKALASLASKTKVRKLACPTFVPLVESGEYEGAFSYELVKKQLNRLHDEQFDTVILGCTHYPILARQIAAALPEGVEIVSSAEETALDVVTALQYYHLPRTASTKPQHVFYATGSVPIFRSIASKWLEQDELTIKKLHLPKY